MKQNSGEPEGTRPDAGGEDEAALQTEIIMEAVEQLRKAKKWSAQRLADEMTEVGVPWTRNSVVNLQTGRRKQIAVHELLALAWVLDVDTPLDLLIPHGERMVYPATPSTLLNREAVRAWWLGETGPLRKWLAQPREGEAENIAELMERVPPEAREQIMQLARSHVQAPKVTDDGES